MFMKKLPQKSWNFAISRVLQSFLTKNRFSKRKKNGMIQKNIFKKRGDYS